MAGHDVQQRQRLPPDPNGKWQFPKAAGCSSVVRIFACGRLSWRTKAAAVSTPNCRFVSRCLQNRPSRGGNSIDLRLRLLRGPWPKFIPARFCRAGFFHEPAVQNAAVGVDICQYAACHVLFLVLREIYAGGGCPPPALTCLCRKLLGLCAFSRSGLGFGRDLRLRSHARHSRVGFIWCFAFSH